MDIMDGKKNITLNKLEHGTFLYKKYAHTKDNGNIIKLFTGKIIKELRIEFAVLSW
jgi:hypothetical protein